MEKVKLMCMGDSVTFGQDGGYRVFLRQMLDEIGFEYAFVGSKDSFGFNEGYPGFKIADLTDGKSSEDYGTSQPIETTLSRYDPDVLLLLVGTNDLYFAVPTDAAEEMKTLLSRALKSHPELHICLGSILPIMPGPKPWGAVVPEDVGKRVIEYNQALEGLAQEFCNQGRQVTFVDIYDCLEDESQLLGDGVHPRPELYRSLAQCWFEALVAN